MRTAGVRLVIAAVTACVAGVASVAAADDRATPDHAVADVADVARRLGFSSGERPLVVTAPNGGSLSARACGSCHRAVYDDWQTTRHRAAWDNAVFLDGLGREPLPRCVHCHAPLLEQKREAGPLRGRQFTQLTRQPTEISTESEPVPPGPTPTPAPGLLHEGVTCAVCHVRDGRVLTARNVAPDDGTPMHPITIEPALKDPAFCASCHQFGFSNSDALMQGTWSEWRAWSDVGGQGTCQSCHMPGGRHLFRGAWDQDLLRRSLQVTVTRGPVLELRSVDVGHHFPTGDLFRHLTVEAASNTGNDGNDGNDDGDDGDDGAFVDIARIGRVFGGTGLDKHVVEDTSLIPGVPRSIHLPPGSRRWRVRYHYAEARHEAAGVVAPVVIAAGTVDVGPR